MDTFGYPLLNRVAELYAETNLENVLLLACQHLLEPQKVMFEKMLALGLRPENCVIIGKNYSTNEDILLELKKLGCIIAPFSLEFDPLQSFDIWFEKKLTDFISVEIARRPMNSYGKILILDDGGHLHIVVNELCGKLWDITGVEQTSSGHHKIKKNGIHFPMISVARSYHKLVFESPYIGILGYERVMQHLKVRGISNPRVLIIGLGHVGRQIAGRFLLVNGFAGSSVDPRFDELRFEKGLTGMFDLFDPEHILRPEQLQRKIKEFDLIIGTTGSPVLTDIDIGDLHPEVLLMSMSSSDREFPAILFRNPDGELHQDYVVRGRTLVNGGFPITFNGFRNEMPPQQIEFTIALLMMSLLGAVSGYEHPFFRYMPEHIRGLWNPQDGADEWYINSVKSFD